MVVLSMIAAAQCPQGRETLKNHGRQIREIIPCHTERHFIYTYFSYINTRFLTKTLASCPYNQRWRQFKCHIPTYHSLLII